MTDVLLHNAVGDTFCVICKNQIPRERASKETCSRQCADTWRQHREEILARTRCPHCYHPSTPEERADFRQWRIERGTLRPQRGRPRQMDTIIRKAIPLLRSTTVDDLVALADEFQKLLDQQPKL